jgi:2-isopropylmalate synthase
MRVYDTTLRDETQQKSISLTVQDKLKITKRLDAFGIEFIKNN